MPQGIIEFIGGQDETTVLIDETLTRSERGRQSPVDVVDDLVGLCVSSGTPPFAIAGLSVHRTRGQGGGL